MTIQFVGGDSGWVMRIIAGIWQVYRYSSDIYIV